MSAPPGLKFSWDGSDLGDLSPFLRGFDSNPRASMLALQSTKEILWVRLYRLDDELPLILDELKELFGVPKLGRHRALLSGKSVMLERIASGLVLNLKELLEQREIKQIGAKLQRQIRRAYAFRWLVGMSQNFDSCLSVNWSEQSCSPYRDTAVTSTPYKLSRRNVPLVAIDKWFGDDQELLTSTIQAMIGKQNPIELRFKIEAVIKRLAKRFVWLTHLIIGRLDQRI